MGKLKTIRRFDILSLCKLVYFIDLIFMIVAMVPMALIGMALPDFPMMGMPMAAPLPSWGSVFPTLAFLMLIAHPLMTTIFCAVAAGIYNVAAGRLGGLKVEIEEEVVPPQNPHSTF